MGGILICRDRKSLLRQSQGVPEFRCKIKKGCQPSFDNTYASNAVSEYQARARLNSGQLSFAALQHHTAGFYQYIVEK